MPMYETMLITSTTLGEENAAVVGKFTDLIEANGTLDAVEEWGKRRLAYPINKQEDGVYTLIHFTAPPEFPAELERVYHITDGVLRSLIVAKTEEMETARLDRAAKAAAARENAAKAAAERAAGIEAAAKAAASEQAQAAHSVEVSEVPAASVSEASVSEAPEAETAETPAGETEV